MNSDMAIKVAVIGIICAVLCVIIRQYKPEFSVFLQIAGIILITVSSAAFIAQLKTQSEELLNFSSIIEDSYIKLMIKVLVIAVTTKLSTDICNDTGNSALASGVEIVGKILILAMCMPLIKVLLQIAEGLLV